MPDPFSSWGSGGGSSGGGPFSDWGGAAPHYDYGSPGGGGGGGGWGLPFHLPGPIGAAAGLVGNLAGDLKDTATNFLPGLYDVGKAAVLDLRDEATFNQHPHNHLLNDFAKPFIHQEAYQWGPLGSELLAAAHGDWGGAAKSDAAFRHRLYEHPLGPILDALTVISGGAGGAARVGKYASVARDLNAPTTAERAALAADAATGGRLSRYAEDLSRPRLLRSPITQPDVAAGEGPGAWPRARAAAESPRYRYATLAKGGTPAMRLVQRLVDRFGEAHPNMPVFGNEKRIGNINQERLIRRPKSVYTSEINAFQDARAKLSKDDRFAFHLGFEGTDPREVFADTLHTYQTIGPSWQMRRYMTRLAGKTWKQIETILKEGGDPMEGSPIVDRVSQMSPELLTAINEGKALEAKSGETLVAANVLDPVARDARKWLAQRIRGGARAVESQDVHVSPHDRYHAQRRELTAQRGLVARGLSQAQREIDRVSQQAARLSEIRAKRGALPEAPEVGLIRDSQAAVDQASERLRAAKATYYGHDPHLEGAQPIADAQAALRASEAELRQVERELASAKAAGVRHVDRLGKAQQQYLKAPEGGRGHDRAYSRLAHHQAERARIDALSATLHKRRNELLAHRHDLTLRRDAAQRAADQIKQRESELVQAEREHSQLSTRHGRAAATYERRRHQHERLASLHERAAQRASEVAQAQRELQGIDEHLAETQRQIEEDISYLGHSPAAAGAARSSLKPLPHNRLVGALQKAPGIMGSAPSVRLIDGTVHRLQSAQIGPAGDLMLQDGSFVDTKLVNAVVDHTGQVIDEGSPAQAPALGRSPQTTMTRRGAEHPNAPQPEDLRTRKDTIHQPSGLEGGPTIDELGLKRWLEVKGLEPAAVDVRAGEPARFPHAASEAGRERGLAPGARSVTAPIEKPAMTKWNRGVRMIFARMELDPSVISRDYLKTAVYKLLTDYRDYIVSKSVPLDLSKGDGLLDGHVYVYGGRRITVPAAIREADPLARDKALTDSRMSRDAVEKLSRQIVWNSKGRPITREAGLRSLHDGVTPADFEGKTVQQLASLGVRQVPERYAKAFLVETKDSSRAVHLLFDRPTDVWRALVLQYVPRWLINNVVGQHLLYLLARGSTARGYLQALATEKSTTGETWVKLWRISIAKRNFKYARMIDEIAPGAMFGAFFRSQELGSPHLFFGDSAAGRYLDELGDRPWTAKTLAPKTGVRAAQVATGIVSGWGDLMSELNLKVADDLPRRALFLSEMKRSLAVRRVQRMAQDFEGANLSLEEAIRRVAKGDHSQIEGAIERVDHALGNFTQMGHFERAYIRRLVPFYSWFKVISKVSLRLPLDSPGRVRFFQLAGDIAAEDGTSFQGGPSYLQGAIVLGPKSGGKQTMLATGSINPFATPIQLWNALNGGQSGTGSPVELLNPYIQAGMTGVSQHDFFYGSDYQGPGSAAPGPLRIPLSTLGYFSGLPEPRLAQQLGWYGDYKSTLYDPNAHTAGVNNYLLNYLGVPVKRVDLSEAASRKRAGQ